MAAYSPHPHHLIFISSSLKAPLSSPPPPLHVIGEGADPPDTAITLSPRAPPPHLVTGRCEEGCLMRTYKAHDTDDVVSVAMKAVSESLKSIPIPVCHAGDTAVQLCNEM